MPVFLSHKREDTPQTLAIADYLKLRQVICYVDVIDPTLRTTDDITDALMKRVRACTHLMAVVSEYTTKSWWVPFEIGVGSQIERRITSYQLGQVTLPDFLTKWPILKTPNDLDLFVAHYRQDQTISLSEARASAPRYQSASQFHRALKTALRQ